jgi:hypothetical protein
MEIESILESWVEENPGESVNSVVVKHADPVNRIWTLYFKQGNLQHRIKAIQEGEGWNLIPLK